MAMRWIFGCVLVAFLLSACRDEPADVVRPVMLEGKTMGTYYRVTYLDSLQRNWQPGIDSLLVELNQEVSTYIDSSTISRFNRSDDPIDLGLSFEEIALSSEAPDKLPFNYHFIKNLTAAREWYRQTGGAFDPTVMPLVNYWGFGYAPKRPVEQVDSLIVDSLRQLVGMEKVRLDGAVLGKSQAGVQLDFSALAKGYGVDEVGFFLERQGVRDYLVDIGGEVRARGLSPRGTAWTVGINTPDPRASTTDVQAALLLQDRSLATSGNYRNYYEVAGRKYAHTISPFTGFPELSTLLSASVFAPDCTTADALATACMVLGPEKALALIERLPGIEAYFIVSAQDGSYEVQYTPGVKPWLLDPL